MIFFYKKSQNSNFLHCEKNKNKNMLIIFHMAVAKFVIKTEILTSTSRV